MAQGRGDSVNGVQSVRSLAVDSQSRQWVREGRGKGLRRAGTDVGDDVKVRLIDSWERTGDQLE